MTLRERFFIDFGARYRQDLGEIAGYIEFAAQQIAGMFCLLLGHQCRAGRRAAFNFWKKAVNTLRVVGSRPVSALSPTCCRTACRLPPSMNSGRDRPSVTDSTAFIDRPFRRYDGIERAILCVPQAGTH